MAHEHDLPDALSIERWHSFGILQSNRELSLRAFFDETVGLLLEAGAVFRTSYGLRLCGVSYPHHVPFVDYKTLPWKLLFPPPGYLTSHFEFLISPDDIGSEGPFRRGVVSFQMDFAEGFMGQFDVSYSHPQLHGVQVAESSYGHPRRNSVPVSPLQLELKACTDVSMRLRELTAESLPRACSFYEFWKQASARFNAILCIGGPFEHEEELDYQHTEHCAFQFGSEFPQWGTRPFEERRLPSREEIDDTVKAFFYTNKCENNPNISHPWPYSWCPVGTL